jgi:hypothetical protein
VKKYSLITDISFVNSNTKTVEELIELFKNDFFNDENKWKDYNLSSDIQSLYEGINSRLKNRMSQLSLGVYNTLENGPGKKLKSDEEIYLFTGFGEIETTNKIIKTIIMDKFNLVSPTLFHNSVHHTSLGYYTIVKNIHNTCSTISDGMDNNLSFINYMNKRDKIDKPFVIVAGEEYSDFYKLDKINQYKIMPAFVSYRISQSIDKGFKFGGVLDSLDDFKNLDAFNKASIIFTDKNTFSKLKNNREKKVLTEYPLVLDNPCGIILRLALPFCFNIKGSSLVIEEINNKFYYFEVVL